MPEGDARDGTAAPGPRVLIVGGSREVAAAVTARLAARGPAPQLELIDAARARDALAGGHWDAAVIDAGLSPDDARAAVEASARGRQEVPVIVLTEPARWETAVELVRAGAVDAVPIGHPDRLAAAIERATHARENRGAAAAAAEVVRRSDARFRSLVQHAADGVALLDTGLRVTYSSPACESLLGRPAGDLLGRDPRDLAVSRGEVHALFSLVASPPDAMGGPDRTRMQTLRVHRGDGSRTWQEWVVTDLRADPSVGGVLLTIRDVSARVETEQRLHLVDRLARRVREHLDVDALLGCMVREVGDALAADHVQAQIIGPEGADAWSMPPWTTSQRGFEPAQALNAGWLMRRLRARRRPVAIDDAAAEAGVGALLAAPICEDDRVAGALIVVSAEAREWSRSERLVVSAVADEATIQLRHARAHAREVESLRRLQELDRAKTDFVSAVSHELRTPLASIVGYLEMLLDGDAGPLESGQTRMLTAIERNSRSLMRLIEDLLVISRIESRSFRSRLVPTDVGPLLLAVAESLAPSVADKDLELDLRVDPGLAPVLGNDDHLEQALLNVLGNAVKFTPEGGRITVTGHGDGDAVVLQVADTGIGVPPEELPQLFTRFFRSSSARELAIPGTGLGLAIVKEIVDEHRGQVAIDSAPGCGTTVTIRLPAAPAVAEATADGARTPNEEEYR